MLRYSGSAWNQGAPVRCWLMVLFSATLMPTPGHPAEKPTLSTAPSPAYCFVRPAGLVCYLQQQHLPNTSSLASRGSTGGAIMLLPARPSQTQSGRGLAPRTGSSRSASQRSPSATQAALRTLTSEPRSTASQAQPPAPAASTDRVSLFRDGFEAGNLSAWSAWAPDSAPVISEEGLPEDGGTTVGWTP